ncbi:hypothetical protein M0802_007242 [Mischocyttarus mexicanus]|nr:hypothetical protein M0802_007242 [Mischocyttarus mexicanus]
MRVLLSFCLAFIACQSLTDGYRILGLFPLNGRSHWQKNPGPNYKETIIKSNIGGPTNNISAVEIKRFGSMNLCHLTHIAGYALCELLEGPEFKNLIENPPNDPPYDLVITELFASHCYLAFGRHLNVPIVGIMTAPFHDWIGHLTGVPHEGSYLPNIFSDFPPKMSFVQRLINTVTIHSLQLQIDYHTEKQTELVKKYFNIDGPIIDLFKNVSLVLVNSHHSLNGIRPLPQSIIEVGGLHLFNNNTEPLQPEVKKWLDDSKHGCIYFTFGSMVRIETFPKEMMEIFYKSFEKIAPTRVLMKVAKEEDLLPGLPKNVMIQKWFSQIPVLQHKNTKAFITHGGLMGTIESVSSGVPMIGLPLFGDQKINIKNYVKRNVAISLGSIFDLTEEKLTNALETILNDPSYKKNVEKLSETFNDRPESAMSKATYWVEYVIKHKNILQSQAIFLPWWERYLFDVYFTIILGLLLVIFVLIYLVKLVIKLVYRKNEKKVDKLKKKKN